MATSATSEPGKGSTSSITSTCPVPHEGPHRRGATASTPVTVKQFGTLPTMASALLKGYGFEDGLYKNLAGHDFARFRIGLRRYVSVTRPEFVEHILVKHVDRYRKAADFGTVDGSLGVGIFSDNDPARWKHHRQLLNPMFSRKYLLSVFNLIMDPIEHAAAALPKQTAEIDMHELNVELTLDVVGNAIFNMDFKKFFDKDIGWWVTEGLVKGMFFTRFLMLAEPPKPLNDAIWKVFHGSVLLPQPFGNFQMAARKVLAGVDAVLANRIANPTNGMDLVNLLLKGIEDGTITRERVRSEAAVGMLAGHETTATTMSFLWHLLSQNHWARDRMLEEIDTVLQGRAPTATDLNNLPWTTACIDEAMRLYPPVWLVPRTAVTDDEIGGHRIKAGTTVFMPTFLIHRDPRWWPNPDAFDPSRFMPGADAGRNFGAYFPFGGGPRVCIGRNLALMEMALIVARFSQTHTFETVPGHRMEPEALFSLRPRFGLRMIASPRT